MAKTINEHFTPQSLPAWAQRYPEVVELAQRDLSYRCDVFDAKTHRWRSILIRVARIRQGWARREGATGR